MKSHAVRSEALTDHASPGFVTYNLVRFAEIYIITPFNSIGCQMSYSPQSCEDCLWALDEVDIIATSIMAAGNSKLDEAISYIPGLPKLFGVAAGVSSKEQARGTFARLRRMAHE